MSTGEAYAFSRQKEVFDQTVARAMLPFAFGLGRVLGYALREQPGEDSNPLFNQERSGVNGVPFDIHKFRTFVSGTREPLGRTALIFRRYGLDELLQARNIRKGEMSVTGHRPIPPEEEEAVFDNAGGGQLVDDWKRVVQPTRPGIISTFSIRNHQHPDKTPNMIRLAHFKLALDIEDVQYGSLPADIGLMAAAFKALVMPETGVPERVAPQAVPPDIETPTNLSG